VSPPNRSICTSKCPKLPAMCHYPRLPHVACTDLPCVVCTNMPRQRPYGLYGLHSQQFFPCLTFQTECDIFSIRTPFDKVNIPPESGRQDGRNGIGFIAFRALSFLSIFQALSGFWIRFRINRDCYFSKHCLSTDQLSSLKRPTWKVGR
jgi:hypothetical protein